MTTKHNARPTLGTSAEDRLAALSPKDTPSGIPATNDTRTRGAGCGHKLTDPLSIARGYGPTCWRRLERARLDDRRGTVGRRLRDVAALVARADDRGVALVAAGLVDLLDALAAEGVAL